MITEKVSFTNSRNQKLAALLDLPLDRQPLAYAIFAHCFTCSKNSKAAARISRALAREGIAVLRFDFTGIGASEGDFAETNFSSNVDDLIQAAAFLDSRMQAPALLLGHSLGGAAVIKAAASIESIRAIVTIATPAEPGHLLKTFADRHQEIKREGEAVIDFGGRSFTVTRQFLDDLSASSVEESLGQLKKALLVMHSPVDNSVGIDHAARLFTAARHPKSFISLDDADHLLSDEQDALYAGKMIAAWACKFLGARRHDPVVQEPDNRVVARNEAGFKTEIIANGHPLVADEPIAVGGANSGPSPYDLLVAGVGACTAMTLRMYAEHKKLPLGAIEVSLTHKKVHATDCDECEAKNGKIDRIEREIAIEGALTGEQRQRLLEIADRCPVHKTLHSEVQVVSRLRD